MLVLECIETPLVSIHECWCVGAVYVCACVCNNQVTLCVYVCTLAGMKTYVNFGVINL